jgi:hypothetical protein
MTWRVWIARPTGRITRHGLTEKAWCELPGAIPADADNAAASAVVERLAEQHGAARAERGAVTIARFAKYGATEVRL